MGDEPETPFILRSPLQPEQRSEAIRQNVAAIERDLAFILSFGYDGFVQQRGQETAENGGEGDDGVDDLGASFEGSLRDYQIYMLERAREENVIVHLGTGMGKTLIAISLMKEYLTRSQPVTATSAEKSHILFLVPSIALAVQHTDTLRADLPCIVATACHTSSHSAKAREEIALADVIVSTHGTALDLLRHYPDVLAMSNVRLLVVDECHYATGKHNYATILRDFYHTLSREERPRVLGLTASPLINVGVHVNESQLQMLLSTFESMMDGRLLGFPPFSAGVSKKEASESEVKYNSLSNGFDTSLPTVDFSLLHKSRKKEIEQLQHLCNEVGLRVTAVYAESLVREVGRNEFEREMPEQLENLKSYLVTVADSLSRSIDEGRAGPHGGHTDKMSKLEELLINAVEHGGETEGAGGQAPVGIVFVERRITALALCNYFCKQRKSGQSGASRQIKCDHVVRTATQIFKYLGRLDSAALKNKLDDDWLHQTKRIRAVIKRLRCRETNVLIATSVVEEGVDVEACQFIICFDGLKTIKSYVQMKGRARQQNAQFFVLVDNALGASQPLSLSDAQLIEKTIHTFIAENESKVPDQLCPLSNAGAHSFLSEEEEALHRGGYNALLSKVEVSSAKSLLNRYAMSVPLDPSCRTSKEAATLHMPIYSENKLILPSHLPPDSREVILPDICHSQNKKKRQSLLALAACVRLHKLGLLNERLLPLERTDMEKWLLEKALIELPSCKRQRPMSFNPPGTVYVYRISQSGACFNEQEREISHNELGELQLAFVSLGLLPESLPSYSFNHKELGRVECGLQFCTTLTLTENEWLELQKFHAVLFNCRWRMRRKKTKWFKFDGSLLSTADPVIAPYVIGCVTASGGIDWMRIRKAIIEFSRDFPARKEAAQVESMAGPRIWNLIYSPGVPYLAYGPSGKRCDAPFPNEEYTSFQNYYAAKHGMEVSPNAKLFMARRTWENPQSLHAFQTSDHLDEDSKEIPAVELPQELCAESPLADPVLMLHSILLPQILYQLERHLTVSSFVEHCKYNFPTLKGCLSEISRGSIEEALTAKSCCLEGVNYDRLEWIGDAVLKLIHTDALLKWEYTSYLHEGYLSMLRSVLGCNDRLRDIAKAAGFDRFILLTPLNRGCWRPFGLRYSDEDEVRSDQHDGAAHCSEPSSKVCADVMEAILGLIFIEFGYEQCIEVACELGLSFRPDNSDNSFYGNWSTILPDPALVSFSRDFVGVESFSNPHLLVEATTHHTCLHKPVPSYQRLEWVGDAVLCLAGREWLFRRGEKLPVARLVLLESTLVSNESLAYVGYTKGLQRFIDHRNSSFPGRFESYKLDLDIGRGLWSTDPPKVIPDVVEALLGAVHVDQGYRKAQEAALHVLSPLIESLSHVLASDIDNLRGMLHPKQHLYELTGGLVSVKVYKKDRFLQLELPLSLWNFGSRGGEHRFVGVVSCKRRKQSGHGDGTSAIGIVLAAVEDSSRERAANVACALAVQILEENPSLLNQLRDLCLK